MAKSTSLDIAKGVFENIPHAVKVWVKDGEYHLVNPNSDEWELIEKDSLEPKTDKKVSK